MTGWAASNAANVNLAFSTRLITIRRASLLIILSAAHLATVCCASLPAIAVWEPRHVSSWRVLMVGLRGLGGVVNEQARHSAQGVARVAVNALSMGDMWGQEGVQLIFFLPDTTYPMPSLPGTPNYSHYLRQGLQHFAPSSFSQLSKLCLSTLSPAFCPSALCLLHAPLFTTCPPV